VGTVRGNETEGQGKSVSVDKMSTLLSQHVHQNK